MRKHIPTIVLLSGFALWSGASFAEDATTASAPDSPESVGDAESAFEKPTVPPIKKDPIADVDPTKPPIKVPGAEDRIPRGTEIIPPADFNPADRSGTIASDKRHVERYEITCGTKDSDGSIRLHLTSAQHPTTRKYFRGKANLSFSGVDQEMTLDYGEIHTPASELKSESYDGVLVARIPAKFFDTENWKILGPTLWFSIPELGIENSTDGGAISLDKECPQRARPSWVPHHRAVGR